MQQREENRRGLQVGQEDARILSLASTLNYLDYFPIIYRDRSQTVRMETCVSLCCGHTVLPARD
jgi:hypothetical protein